SIVVVSERSVLVVGGHRLEMMTPSAGAHTIADLVLVDTANSAAYVGDLVNPGHCPMMSDPLDDPKGWLAALDRIQGYRPSVLVPTRGDASKLVESDIAATRT